MRSVIFITVLVFSALLLPRAYVEARGSLVKGSMSAVYYVADDGTRFVFPNERIYFSWYPDFSEVSVISDETLAGYAIGGSVTYRPGTRLVKLTGDPRVYAVEPGGVLRWISTEAVARAVWGDDWAKRVDDLPDGFFPAYTTGTALSLGEYPNGTLLRDVSSGLFSVVWDGEHREITEAGMTANDWQSSFAVDVDGSSLPRGEVITGEETVFADTAQLEQVGEQDADVIAATLSGATTIFSGEEQQLLARFVFSVGREVTLKDPVFFLHARANTDKDADPGGLIRGDGEDQVEANLQRIHLVDARGTALFGTASLVPEEALDGTQRMVLPGTHTFLPGRHVVRLFADVPEETPEHEEYAVGLSLTDSVWTSRGVEVRTSPKELEAPDVAVREPGLALARASGAKDLSVLRGQTGPHEALAFEILNPLTESVRITRLVLNGFVNGGAADVHTVTLLPSLLDHVTLVRDGIDILDSTSVIGADGSVVFDDVDWVMGAGETWSLAVRVDMNASAPFGIDPDRFWFDVTNASAIEAETLVGEEVAILGTEFNAGGGAAITVAKHGRLTIEGGGGGPDVLVMGSREQDVYALQFNADAVEDIVVDQLTVRVMEAEAARSVSEVMLRFTSEGVARTATAAFAQGNATFSNLNLIVPKDTSGDQEVPVSISATIASSAQGAVSGDEIAFTFEPVTFRAHGAVSGEELTQEDIGGFLEDQSEDGTISTIRKNQPRISKPEQQVDGSIDRSSEESLLRFRVSSSGEGSSLIQQLVFKIESSDVGYTLNEQGSDNDLLERLADLNGDWLDDNDVAELIDESTDDPVGEGSSGHLDFSIYDESARRRDTTPEGLDTARGDYGVLTYEFTSPIRIPSTGKEFTLLLHTEGLAAGSQSIRATVLGGDDFRWSDGSSTVASFSGGSISGLPYAGPTVGAE